MNSKTKFAIVATLALLSVSLARPVNAFPNPQIFGYADKPSYHPGDSGTLTITVQNQGTTAANVKNVTVRYSWAQPWTSGGVENTTNTINTMVAAGGTTTITFSFTIPNDGRVGSIGQTAAFVSGKTNATSFGGNPIAIPVALPVYQPTPPAQSFTDLLIPIVNLVLLVVAVAFLGMLWMSMRGMPKKSSASAPMST